MEKNICWQVYTVVTETNRPIPERLKDWVTTPKANGYESLHTTVVGPKGRFVEVQIRSERMHEIAEKGFAAHWKYKGVKQDNFDVFSDWLDNIREILDNATSESDAVEFISDVRTNLFNEEIYVYTPKGELKILPEGATALDFAFYIHSEVGYHCKAVTVNNQLVPLGYKLKSGDQVSVVTNKAQKPSEGWLNYVVTGKARSKIRSSMKEEIRKKGEMGKEKLMRKMKNLKADFESNTDMLVQHFGFVSRPDLYYAIFKDEINIQKALKQFKVEGGKMSLIEEPKPAQPEKQEEKQTFKSRRNFKGKAILLIDNKPAEQFKHSLASCCNPVLGDPVFAYITAMGEAKIHRNTCPNAEHLMANYAYRMMKAEWVDSDNTDFVTTLLITGIDGRGVAQKITGFITNDLKLDMRSISMDGNQGFFQGRIKVVVKNKDQLHLTMKALKKIDGVHSVIRED